MVAFGVVGAGAVSLVAAVVGGAGGSVAAAVGVVWSAAVVAVWRTLEWPDE